MHQVYNPNDINVWLTYYGNQALQTGYGIEGYQGFPYQRGAGLGSFFKSLFRMAVPIFKSAGKEVGKHALTAGANVISDLARGQPVFETVKRYSKAEALKMLQQVEEALQKGEGLGIMPKSINTIVSNDIFSKKTVRKRYGTNK